MNNFKKKIKNYLTFSIFVSGIVFFDAAISATYTESNNTLRTPGVGFQETMSHPPTDVEVANCDFDDNSGELDAAYLNSGSIYVRLLWQDFEPSDNNFNFDLVDGLLACAKKEGKSLDFRVKMAWPKFPMDKNSLRGLQPGVQYSIGLPSWLPTSAGYWTDLGSPGQGYYIANWNNSTLVSQHTELIQALGNRYDGHPNLNSVDVGSIGNYGEWHYYVEGNLSGPDWWLPNNQQKKDVVLLYANSFPNTPLIGLEDPFFQAVNNGTDVDVAEYIKNTPEMGWRGDSWGGNTGDYSFNARYSLQHQSYIQNLWQTGPISLEISGNNFEAWAATPANYDDLWTSINYAKTWHASMINSKSGAIPEGFKNSLYYLAKNLGYRLVLDQATHNGSITSGNNLLVSMKWRNVGVAPAYRDFRIAFRLKDGNGNVVSGSEHISDVSVKGWVQGNDIYRDVNYSVPSGVSHGNYTVETAIVFHSDIETTAPIAVTEAGADKWVAIDQLSVTGGEQGTFKRVVAGGSDSANTDAADFDSDMWRITDNRDDTGSWSNGGLASKAYVDLYLDRTRKVTSVQYSDENARKISVAVFDDNGNWVHGIEQVATQPGINTINFPSIASGGGEVVGSRVSVWSGTDFGYLTSSGDLWFTPNEIKVFGSAQ